MTTRSARQLRGRLRPRRVRSSGSSHPPHRLRLGWSRAAYPLPSQLPATGWPGGKSLAADRHASVPCEPGSAGPATRVDRISSMSSISDSVLRCQRRSDPGWWPGSSAPAQGFGEAGRSCRYPDRGDPADAGGRSGGTLRLAPAATGGYGARIAASRLPGRHRGWSRSIAIVDAASGADPRGRAGILWDPPGPRRDARVEWTTGTSLGSGHPLRGGLRPSARSSPRQRWQHAIGGGRGPRAAPHLTDGEARRSSESEPPRGPGRPRIVTDWAWAEQRADSPAQLLASLQDHGCPARVRARDAGVAAGREAGPRSATDGAAVSLDLSAVGSGRLRAEIGRALVPQFRPLWTGSSRRRPPGAEPSLPGPRRSRSADGKPPAGSTPAANDEAGRHDPVG